MNKNNYLSLRVDVELKEKFYAFCKGIGMNASGAINLLVVKCIKEERIPFKIENCPNTMISQSSVRISIRMAQETREKFSRICKELGISMSMIIKMYMIKCINTNAIPF